MKRIFLFFIIAMNCGFCFAQENSGDSTSPKSTLTLAAIYSNNVNYYGQRPEEQTPYIAIAADYRLVSGIYFSAQSYKLLNDNTTRVSAAALGVGVSFNLSKDLTTDISYSHSFYPEHSPLLQAANNDNASISVSYDGWVKPTITGNYAFGKTNDVFVTGGLSKAINLFSISNKDIVAITPSADIVAGSQHFIQTYITEKKIRDSLVGIITGPIFGNPPSEYESNTVSYSRFDILSYNFKLPLAYYRTHYVVEAAAQVSVLSNQAQSGPGKVNSFFTLSFYYQF